MATKVTKVKTVGELKACLETIDPNTPLNIRATGRDPEADPAEDIELSIDPAGDGGMVLDCFLSPYSGIFEISNANVDDMIYNPY